ncbi:MAG: VOC family protein [Sulfitobacter sp.]
MSYKPDGYTSVAPYLIVRDAEASLAFVETVFQAVRLRVIPRDTGGIMHAEARIDDTVVMMGEMPEGPDAHVHIYVAEPQVVFQRALDAGGQVVQALKDMGDGDMRGGVSDANGTVWWIASQIG